MDSKTKKENQALIDFSKGDLSKLEEILGFFQPQWLTVARNLVEPQAVKDIMQSFIILLYVMVGGSYSEEKGNARSYLYRCFVNHCFELLRKTKPVISIETGKSGKEEDGPLEFPSPDPSPELILIDQDLVDRLTESIPKLREEYQLVIRLYYFMDLKVAEISAQLGIPEGTVKQRLHAARKELRDLIDPPRRTKEGPSR